VTLAKQLARVGAVKTLLLTMRAHLKVEEVNEEAAAALRSIGEASDGCRKLLIEAHGVPMLAIAMKRHSLSTPMQRDGCAALAALCLGSAAGLAAMAKEKEGVEVLVAAMLLCAREKVPFEAAKEALRKLADSQPALLKRIERANGNKWLRGQREEMTAVAAEGGGGDGQQQQEEEEAAAGAERKGEALPP